MGRTRLSVAMPFYNEGENVTQVITDLESAFEKENLEDYQIVAVNNGSWDQTGELLKEHQKRNPRIKIVTVPVNKGLGYGILQGFDAADGENIGFNCGDGQISAEDVMKVWRKHVQEDLDISKVRRVVRNDGFSRLIISVVFNGICKVLFGVKSTDINGIPKILKRETLEKLGLASRDWFIDAEMMIKATQHGCKIGEVDVEFLKREGGSSHINYLAVLEFFKNLFVYRITGLPYRKKESTLTCAKQ